MKNTYEVITKKIKIKFNPHTFSFKYRVWMNGELLDEDTYNDIHDWNNKKEFKSLLKEGYASYLALCKALG